MVASIEDIQPLLSTVEKGEKLSGLPFFLSVPYLRPPVTKPAGSQSVTLGNVSSRRRAGFFLASDIQLLVQCLSSPLDWKLPKKI